MFIETQVAQQHGPREKHGSRIGLVFSFNVEANMSASRFKYSYITAHIASRHNAGTSHERSTYIRKNTPIEVGHDHDIKLLRSRDSLHGCIVNDHVVDGQGWVLLGDLVESVSEQAVGKLHNVGFVYASDFLPVICKSEAESKLGYTLRLRSCDDLQGLDDACDGLVLQARIFTLGVLSNDAQIHIVMTRFVARDILDEDNGRIDIKLLA